MKLSTAVARRVVPLLFRTTIGLVSISLALLLGCLQLFSQGNAGRMLGSITDQTGGAIAGATVTIIDTQRNVTRTLLTDTAGEFSAPNLLPSTYTVRAEAKGFKTTERAGIVLEVNQDLRVDLSVQPGEQTEKITVTGEIPLVETTNAELGGTLQNAVINDLPLNGRNFENLLTLRPGVTIYPGGGGWTQSTNGMRAHDNVYLVDGVNADDPWMAQSIMNAGMASGDAGTILPIDAIDEFKTEQNPRAEYGWKPGSIVSVGLKSGTNSMHGSAYAFGRTSSWDARDYFNPPPNPVAPLSFQQFGASLGGPIKKDKLFYFLNFEDQRYTVGNPLTHNGVPVTSGAGALDQTTGTGLRGACLTALAAGGVAPLSAQLAGLSTTCVPLSNYPGLFPVNANPTDTLNTSINSSNRIDSGMAKIDYHLNDKHSINGMYFISPGNGILSDNTLVQLTPAQLTVQYARAQVFAANWTYIPSSTWVNEARFGYSHYFQTFVSNDHTQDPANYAFNGATYHLFSGQTNPAYFGLPVISFSSTHQFELGASWPKTVGPDGVFNFVDHVSYLRGKHAFRFGFELLENRSTTNVTSNAKGPIRFADLNSFFEGVPNRANFLSGDLLRHMHNSAFAVFVQDDWRVKPRITVNLGLRYELNGVLKENNNLLGNFDPSLGLVQVGGAISTPYNGDHNNFAPRLGLAWDVKGNGKTVVRAGVGIMYEQFSYDMFNAIGNLLGLRMVPTGVPLYANGNQVPSPGNIAVGNISFTGTALKGGAPGDVAFDWINNSSAFPLYTLAPACGDGKAVPKLLLTPQPCNVLGTDRNLRNPYVTTWTLDLQRALTANLSLDLAYVGNHGTKLIGLTDINQPPLGAGWTAAAVGKCLATGDCSPDSDAQQAARPFNAKFPYLQYIDWLSNLYKSNYNALQAALTERTSHGLSFTVGYTYSHALDQNSDNWSFTIPIYNNNPGLLYGNSTFDITHRGTISATYDIPGRKGFAQMLEGWSLNSIVTLQSGLPWGIADATNDFSGTNEVNQPADGQEEQWNFYGNPKDFQPVHGFTQLNGDILAGGTGGIPYFSDTSNPTCAAKALALDGGKPGLATAALANTGCYAMGSSILIPPAFGTYGTSGRDIFRDGGFRNWDLSVFKTFKFKERLSAQFRAEFFNFLNHPTFSNPGGPGGGAGTTDPSAGAGFGCGCVTPDTGGSNPVLGSGGPRAIQLGLKLLF
jgi:hypothetical protein